MKPCSAMMGSPPIAVQMRWRCKNIFRNDFCLNCAHSLLPPTTLQGSVLHYKVNSRPYRKHHLCHKQGFWFASPGEKDCNRQYIALGTSSNDRTARWTRWRPPNETSTSRCLWNMSCHHKCWRAVFCILSGLPRQQTIHLLEIQLYIGSDLIWTWADRCTNGPQREYSSNLPRFVSWHVLALESLRSYWSTR